MDYVYHESIIASVSQIVCAALHAGELKGPDIEHRILSIYATFAKAASQVNAHDLTVGDPVARALKETRGALAGVDFMDDER